MPATTRTNPTTRQELLSLRAKFGKCVLSAHKQIGLRRVRDALYFLDRNLTHAEECAESARLFLRHAMAITKGASHA